MTQPAAPAKSGVCYASTATGEPLPVIDITNPAFALTQTDEELAAMVAKFRDQQARWNRRPRWTRRLFHWLFLRKSEFIRRLRASGGSFLDGMSTYRMKLGPDHLDPARVSAIDRRLASTAPFLLMRVRLHDMARFMADDLAPRLADRPEAPLHLVNIAGGPSMDSLNALLLLRQRDPPLLRGRRVEIHLLDQDDQGPTFAGAALASLKEDAAPLAGIDVSLTHVHYRWDDTAVLREPLARIPAGSVIAASSEGGLFNYASDEAVLANLRTLRELLPADASIVGSLSPPESAANDVPVGQRIAICLRDLPPFRELVAGAGWCVARSIERRFYTVFLLQQT